LFNATDPFTLETTQPMSHSNGRMCKECHIHCIGNQVLACTFNNAITGINLCHCQHFGDKKGRNIQTTKVKIAKIMISPREGSCLEYSCASSW